MNRGVLPALLALTVACADDAVVLPPPPPPPPSTPGSSFGNLSAGFLDRQVVLAGTTYKFQIYVPVGYAPTRSWPVVVFLHASGQRGSDGVAPTLGNPGSYIRANTATFPAVVVFPQFPLTPEPGFTYLPLVRQVAKAELDQTLREVRADSARIYLTGWSYGAYRSWELAYESPNLFAAIVPISGALCAGCVTGDANANAEATLALVAARLKDLKAWAFHGGADEAVPVADDQHLVQVFRSAGSSILYTEYPGQPHYIPDLVYGDSSVWSWLFVQHK